MSDLKLNLPMNELHESHVQEFTLQVTLRELKVIRNVAKIMGLELRKDFKFLQRGRQIKVTTSRIQVEQLLRHSGVRFQKFEH